MILPERNTGQTRKKCTWKDGCDTDATTNSRFCVKHCNATQTGMYQSSYLQQKIKDMRFFYRSTIRHLKHYQ